MSSLWIASSVTTTNGSSLITVQSNEDIAGIRPNSLIQVGANPLMEVKRTFLSDSGVKTIELFESWQFGAGTGQRAIAAPTLGEIKQLATDVRQLITSAEQVVELSNVTPTAGSIAKRTSDGRTKTADATEANDAVAYGQFDGLEAELRNAVDQSIADNEEKFAQIETQTKFDESATLIMDYANNRYERYSQFEGKKTELASAIETFSRGSSKTGFTPTGLAEAPAGVPLNVIDPETGEALGRSIHEQRTNLLTQSERIDLFVKNATTIGPNVIAAPDGSITADEVIEDTPDTTHFAEKRNLTGVAGTYTQSIFVKAGTVNYGVFTVVAIGENPQVSDCPFELSTGSITANGLVDSAKIENVGNGWYRLSVAYTLTADRNDVRLRIYIGSANTRVGDNVSSLYLWGAQLEQGSFPTPYIPTTTAQVTRQADVCSIDDITPWWNSNEGTIVCQFKLDTYKRQYARVLQFEVSGEWQGISIQTGADSQNIINIYYRYGPGTVYAIRTSALLSDGDNVMIAVSYKDGNIVRGSINGGPVGGTTVPVLFENTSLTIGNNGAGGAFAGGSIARLTYTPTAVSDSELQKLSKL